LLEIRSKYSLSQSEIEKILTIGPKTWVRWERGKVVQGSAADQMVRLIAKRPEVLRELMRNAGVENLKTSEILEAHDREIEERMAAVLRTNLRSGKKHGAVDFERAAKAAAEAARKFAVEG
jgi:transcriptional regulator with XRE-family HTH domain